jgi:heat shock protein HtpX
MLTRIVLFALTNIAVLFVLSVVVNLLGLEPMLSANGLNLTTLLVFAGVMGFGGAFISLAMSKMMAKWSMGLKVIKEPENDVERWLVATVRRQADQAGIGMPEVAIWDSPIVNAFATGMSRDNALVAVSTGLMRQMSKDEVEAVLGHEVSHVANGDMVTMALLQGVLNTFVIVLSRVAGYIVDRVILKNERGHGLGFMLTSIVAQILLGILASLILAWFSRRREFVADQGGASLSSRMSMIKALEALQRQSGPQPLPDSMAAFGITALGGAFATHPPLAVRIEALKRMN